MCPRQRHAKLAALLLGILCSAATLAQTAQKPATGIITGRVTSGDKGMANVSVQLFAQETVYDRSAVAKATTDYQGNYRMTNVPAGRYMLYVLAPAMVGDDNNGSRDTGKSVTLAEGETVEKADFALIRGGVITGRVTDANGAPVIGEHVQLNQPNSQRRFNPYSFANPYMYQTDDRGVYRIYGIQPGKYTVSIGEAKDSGSIRIGFGGRGYYTRTFYPDATDEAKATVIEVTEGSEASNIDITLGRKEKSYAASGRTVDESGQPAPNVRIAISAKMKDGRPGGFGGGMPSDAQGRFRVDGLLPGHYSAFLWSIEGSSDNYSDPVDFEIADSDVSGLEIKLHRGASISGVVTVEGTTDSNLLAKLSQFSINAVPVRDNESGRTIAYINFANTKIAPDMTFRLTGIRPGKFNLNVWSYPPVPGFSLSRIEHDGVAQREFEITPGAQVTGVRLVFAYGSGSIRGLVKVEGDAASAVRRMMVAARPATQGVTLQIQPVQVDSRGHFLIEGLPTGEYDVVLNVYPNTGGQPPGPVRPQIVRQKVSVTNGIESEVTFTFNPNQMPPEGGNNE